MLPYAGLDVDGILSVVIGSDSRVGLFRHYRLCAGASAWPHRPGGWDDVRILLRSRRSGVAAGLGRIADLTGIETVYRICSFLPLIACSPPCCLTSSAGSNGSLARTRGTVQWITSNWRSCWQWMDPPA